MSETDEIIAQCSINKVSGIHKSDIENLMSQLTQLLDEMVRNVDFEDWNVGSLSTILIKHTFVAIASSSLA